MDKNFDAWNELKKKIDVKTSLPFCSKGEIWWCSLGLNIGSEENGKNKYFERPVLILKVLNMHMVRMVPMTSMLKEDINHVIINYNTRSGSAKISQLKTISTKRLTRKISNIDSTQFDKVTTALRKNLL